MKLIIFNSQNQVLDIFLSNNIVIDGENIEFDNSKIYGMRGNYIVVDDSDTDVSIGDKIPEVLKEKDKKHSLTKQKQGEELEDDVNQLKEETVNQMQAIADIYELLLGEGSVK